MEVIKKYLRSSLIYILYRHIRFSFFAYKRLNTFIKQNRHKIKKIIRKEKRGKKILLATSIGSELFASRLETIIGISLMQRGHNVEYSLCDKILSACQSCTYSLYGTNLSKFISKGPKNICGTCFDHSAKKYEELGFEVNPYSKYLDQSEIKIIKELSESLSIEEITNYKEGSVTVGEHAKAGALRFFARGDLRKEKEGERVLRQYFYSALLVCRAFKRLFVERNIDVVVLHHGIYVPQGIISSVAREKGVRVVTWNIAYRKNRFIFSHDDTYHHALIDEPPEVWKNLIMDNKMLSELDSYLESRWYGKEDWIRFGLENPNLESSSIKKELKLDNRPIYTMYTNVIWDAQLHYPTNAFESMVDWLIETVKHFEANKDSQLVIRVHPAEKTGRIPSRQTVAEEINEKFGDLPENIKLVDSDSKISSYQLANISKACIIYGTKMGVELSSMGKIVIVAGEAWIRNKGLTIDAKSKDEYLSILTNISSIDGSLSEEIKLEAKKYAYHFFFRRMIKLDSVKQIKGWPPYDIDLNQLSLLKEGADPGLDVICNGITKGSEFIYD